MDNENFKHVRFDLFCPTCTHNDEEESDPYKPCNDCLAEFARQNSTKPVNYVGKETK